MVFLPVGDLAAVDGVSLVVVPDVNNQTDLMKVRFTTLSVEGS